MARQKHYTASVLLLALLAGACASQSATHTTTPAVPGPSTTRTGTASRTAQDIGTYAEAAFPNTYTGVALAADQRTILVYRIPDPALDSAVRARFPATPLRFVDARYSHQRLQALARRITADIPFWNSHGIRITLVGPAADGSAVTVGTPDPATASSPIYARYGRDAITIIPAAPDDGPAPAYTAGLTRQ